MYVYNDLIRKTEAASLFDYSYNYKYRAEAEMRDAIFLVIAESRHNVEVTTPV